MVKDEADNCTTREYRDIATLAKEAQAELLCYVARLEQKSKNLKVQKKFKAAVFVDGLIKTLKKTAKDIGTE